MEHRWGERLKVALPVRIDAACGLVGAGLVVNFSVSGAFIATTLPVRLLSQVRVNFVLGGRTARLRRGNDATFEGQVVRRSATGFAIEWCEFGTDEVVALANYNRADTPVVQHRTRGTATASVRST
jgi:uncharacterized protein (DUF58 family)